MQIHLGVTEAERFKALHKIITRPCRMNSFTSCR